MDRSEVERKSFSIWSFICYVVLENEVLQLHLKPVYYLIRPGSHYGHLVF